MGGKKCSSPYRQPTTFPDFFPLTCLKYPPSSLPLHTPPSSCFFFYISPLSRPNFPYIFCIFSFPFFSLISCPFFYSLFFLFFLLFRILSSFSLFLRFIYSLILWALLSFPSCLFIAPSSHYLPNSLLSSRSFLHIYLFLFHSKSSSLPSFLLSMTLFYLYSFFTLHFFHVFSPFFPGFFSFPFSLSRGRERRTMWTKETVVAGGRGNEWSWSSCHIKRKGVSGRGGVGLSGGLQGACGRQKVE